MAAGLTPEQVKIIKATIPVIAQYGETVTTKFYHDMLEANPELRNIFNNTHQLTGHQPRALAGSLFAYASNIDDLGKLSPAVELICHKHASLYIQPEQYAIVGKHLIETFQTVLGDAFTPEIKDAWGAAYWQLANIMIEKEKGLYESSEGWTDWCDFKIVRKEVESEEITSFYLAPVDAKPLPKYKPGQYISVRLQVPDLFGGVLQARQYSLSDRPRSDYYRISVKREEALDMGDPKVVRHPGFISNLLHKEKQVGDTVQVSHPFGDFFFAQEAEGERKNPIVLISAGVGLTCLTSILNHVLEEEGGDKRKVTWIHGARTSVVRAFKKHIDQATQTHENIKSVFFVTKPADGEAKGKDYDFEGRINLDKVNKDKLFLQDKGTQYFVCGPTQFMLDVEEKLKNFGVEKNRVHVELFGTGGVPRV